MSRTFGNWIRFGLIAGAVGLGVAPASAQFHPEIPKAPGTGITRVAAQLPPTPIDTFGVDRVMFGGDWPVVTLAGTYADWLTALREILSKRPEADQKKILHDNAAKFYGI